MAEASSLKEILLWSARESGPVTHFWFVKDGIHRRVCDGVAWSQTSLVRFDGTALPCRDCKELYVEDVVYGQKILTLASSDFTPHDGVEPLYNRVHPSYNVVEPSHNGVASPRKEVFGVPSVALSQFANFYEVRPAGQVKVVRQVREQLASPEMFRRHNFYGLFHDEVRRTHLSSRDIRDFEDRLLAFVSNLNDVRKQQPYLELGRAYVAYWKSRSGELFVAKPVVVEINGLEVRVRPEIGIRVRGDAEVLHLWFKNIRPGRQAKQVILHFMDRARSQSPDWSDSWNVGIWDVRRKEVPPPVRTAQDFELGLEGQVASFLRIWAMLEDAGPID